MAGKTRTVSLEMIKKSGADINVNGIYYDSIHDRAFVKDPEGKKVYISASKTGGHKEMFYAAAGLRNYISKYGKRPDKSARNQIINRALNAEKAKAIWKERYKKNKETSRERRKNPFRKNTPELKTSQDCIVIDVPKLSTIGKDTPMKHQESFETVVQNALRNGIISSKSAAFKKKKGKHIAEEEIQKLGMDMDPRYITFLQAKKGQNILIRITTCEGLQRVELKSKNFNDEVEMFKAADEVRRFILKTGKTPEAAKKEARVDGRPIPSKVNPPQRADEEPWPSVILSEQQVKSKGTEPSIFSKIKMWIFG
jgi:hypothetical protein